MKMPTVNTLAFGNLKTRKKQYALMIVGIILAMVFSSGSMFLISSISKGIKDITYQQNGYQNEIFFGMTDDTLKDGIEALDITDYADGENLGYLYSEDETAGTSVAKMSDEAKEMYYTRVIEGRYPENAGEIAFEEDAAVRMKLKAAVGDKITLNLKVQSGNEYLTETVKKTYTLTGIIGNRRNYIARSTVNSPLLPAAFVSEKETVEAGGKTQRITFVKYSSEFLKHDTCYDKLYKFYVAHSQLEAGANNGFVETLFPYAIGTHDLSSSNKTAAILSVMLMLVSCVGIVNAFNANLLERKKQIGFLRALGTTRRQIIKIYGREALILSLICTPVSLIISFFGTKLLVKIIGGDMMFFPDWKMLIIGAVFSIICVMTAALIPLLRATKIAPMQAVRNIDMTRRMKNRKIKSQKEFSMPKLLSKRNMTFSKGRTAAVSIILIACILISGAGFAAAEYIKNDTFEEKGDYQIHLGDSRFGSYTNLKKAEREMGVSPNSVNDILCSPYVKSVSGHECRTAVVSIDRESDYLKLADSGNYISSSFVGGHSDYCDFTKENYLDILEQLRLEDLHNVRSGDPPVQYDDDYGKNTAKDDYRKAFSLEGEFSEASINSYEESYVESLQKKAVAGKINIDKINSGEEVILEAPNKIGLFFEQEKYDLGLSVTHLIFPLDKNSKTNSKRVADNKVSKYTLVDSADLDLKVGDEIEVSMLFNNCNDTEGVPADKLFSEEYTERASRKAKIGAIIDKRPDGASLGIITTNQGFRTIGKESCYTEVNVYLNTECAAEVDESVCKIIDPIISGTNGIYSSKYQIKQEEQNSYRILLISIISVILLMATICTSLINNALTARIRESKKEIGTLRAVGASVSELTKSYILQLLSMFGIGLVSGFSIYALGISGIKIYEKIAGENTGFSFNIWIPLAVCAVIFIVCAVNLYSQIKKQTKSSIVDNIREL